MTAQNKARRATGTMTDAQKLRIAFFLVTAQCFLLVMTLGFKAVMDVQADRHGIAAIITQAGK